MDFSFLSKYWAYFNYGVLVTIMISACVVFFGTIIGVLVALIKRSRIKVLDWLVSFYVWIFRGTPMVVQIMISFVLLHFTNMPIVKFGVLDLDFSRLLPGIIVLSLNSGAYISEVVRAGIEAVPKGQLEAGLSIGLTSEQTFVRIIAPQAFKVALPNITTAILNLMRDAALAYTIGFIDVMGKGNLLISRHLGNYSLETYTAVAFVYWGIALILSLISRIAEQQLSVKER